MLNFSLSNTSNLIGVELERFSGSEAENPKELNFKGGKMKKVCCLQTNAR